MDRNAGTIETLLPRPLPSEGSARLLLFGFRRLATHGLQDAHAANAMIGGFGLGFRRPLILLRALMAELSRVSNRKIVVAPCCCLRMTTAGRIIEAIGYVNFYLLTTLAAVPGIVLFWAMMRAGLIDQSIGSAGTEKADQPSS
jgi:hypothetical protein